MPLFFFLEGGCPCLPIRTVTPRCPESVHSLILESLILNLAQQQGEIRLMALRWGCLWDDPGGRQSSMFPASRLFHCCGLPQWPAWAPLERVLAKCPRTQRAQESPRIPPQTGCVIPARGLCCGVPGLRGSAIALFVSSPSIRGWV